MQRQHHTGDRVVVYKTRGYSRISFREGTIVEELGLFRMSTALDDKKQCFKYLVWFRRAGNRIIVDGNDGYTVCNPRGK